MSNEMPTVKMGDYRERLLWTRAPIVGYGSNDCNGVAVTTAADGSPKMSVDDDAMPLSFFDQKTGEFVDSVQTRVKSRLTVHFGNPFKDKRGDTLVPEAFLNQRPPRRGVRNEDVSGPTRPPGSPPHDNFSSVEGEGEAVFASPTRTSPQHSTFKSNSTPGQKKREVSHESNSNQESKRVKMTDSGKDENDRNNLPEKRPPAPETPPKPPQTSEARPKPPPSNLSRPPPPVSNVPPAPRRPAPPAPPSAKQKKVGAPPPPKPRPPGPPPSGKPKPPQRPSSNAHPPPPKPKPPKPPSSSTSKELNPPKAPSPNPPFQRAPPPGGPPTSQKTTATSKKLQVAEDTFQKSKPHSAPPPIPKIATISKKAPIIPNASAVVEPASETQSPDKEPAVNLPPGWMAVWSKSQKRWYYFDTKTKRSVWQWPPPN